LKDRYDLEADYREIYWRLNEYQLLATDSVGDKEMIASIMDELSKNMAAIVAKLGYVPGV
jgi:hypothetical protein